MDKKEFLQKAGFISLNEGNFHFVNTSHEGCTIIASLMGDNVSFTLIVPGDKRTVCISTAVYENITEAYDELLNSIKTLGNDLDKVYKSLKNS